MWFLNMLSQREERRGDMDKKYNLECPSFEMFLKNNEKIERSEKSRDSALDFAHPVDAGIIRVLDSPMVNKAFAGLVDLTVDAQYGLIFSTGLRIDDQESEIGDIIRNKKSLLTETCSTI